MAGKRLAVCIAKGILLASVATSALVVAAADHRVAGAPGPALVRSWGRSVVRNTLAVFYLPKQKLLAETAVRAGHGDQYRPGGQPAFAWSQSMVLLMLAEGVKCHAVSAQVLHTFVGTLGPYWRVADGVGGFDVLPGKVPLDRYYDDNGWMAWGFLRAYAATGSSQYLVLARRDFQFILSGESSALGGGIFWHEQVKKTKNTCSNGPAIIDALKLYSITGQHAYLHTARTIYVWVNKHLLDYRDYLYFDNIAMNGTIVRTKWTYNTGTMLIANCLFYRITHQKKYWRRATRLARASQLRWLSTTNGSIRGPGVFAWVLIDGYIQLYKISGDNKFLVLARRALIYAHDHCRVPGGFYAGTWNTPAKAGHTIKLINQACIGSSYFSLVHALTH